MPRGYLKPRPEKNPDTTFVIPCSQELWFLAARAFVARHLELDKSEIDAIEADIKKLMAEEGYANTASRSEAKS